MIARDIVMKVNGLIGRTDNDGCEAVHYANAVIAV